MNTTIETVKLAERTKIEALHARVLEAERAHDAASTLFQEQSGSHALLAREAAKAALDKAEKEHRDAVAAAAERAADPETAKRLKRFAAAVKGCAPDTLATDCSAILQRAVELEAATRKDVLEPALRIVASRNAAAADAMQLAAELDTTAPIGGYPRTGIYDVRELITGALRKAYGVTTTLSRDADALPAVGDLINF